MIIQKNIFSVTKIRNIKFIVIVFTVKTDYKYTKRVIFIKRWNKYNNSKMN